MEIEDSIRFQHYRTIRQIAADFAQPVGMERSCRVFWGRTGTYKSTRAWQEAGVDVYGKDPRTKFWCGYRGQENVVIDEFRGAIDISHLLRWLDRFPVHLEIKGSSVPCMVKRYWITSNLNPLYWYADLDTETKEALFRRMEIIEFE